MASTLVVMAILFLYLSAGAVLGTAEGLSSFAILANSAYSISLPMTVPSNASPVIDASFPGFAFEDISIVMYAGPPGQPNSFSVNLFDGITSRTGTKPSVRVGGTSLDRAKYVASQQEAISFPPGQSGNVPSDVTLGPAYFHSFPNFADARYTFCLPLAAANLSNTVEMARAGYAVLKNQLEFIEIGNEPNSYPGSVRSSSYTPQDYVSESVEYSNAVSKALGLAPSDPIYQAIALGSPDLYQDSDSAAVPGPWYPNALFQDGLSRSVGEIGAVSMHWYQTLANPNESPTQQLQKELMNHNIMVTKMTFYQSAINYFAANYPRVRVNIAEAASSLNGATNDYGLESTFGAALWQVDWMLWCMHIGVHRIAWQQISASAYDLWQPTTYKGRNPAVLPPYYAMLFAADFIGTSGDTRVVNVDLKSDTYSAYGAYATLSGFSAERLARIAIINLDFWSGSGTRPSQTFHLAMPSGVHQVRVKYLNSAFGATANNGSSITWEGYQWTIASNGKAEQVKDDTATVNVVNEIASVVVNSSEAVMVIPQY